MRFIFNSCPCCYLNSRKSIEVVQKASSIDKEKIANLEDLLKHRVMGQDQAISKTVNIVKRAVSGLSGLQHSSGQNKPRGVLFFAGPTGTGKTMASLYPALKSVGEGVGDKIFYFTGKTTTALAALNAIEIMRAQIPDLRAIHISPWT